MNESHRLQMQDRTMARLYREMPVDQRIEANQRMIEMLAGLLVKIRKLSPEAGERLIRVAQIQALEEMDILPPLEDIDG